MNGKNNYLIFRGQQCIIFLFILSSYLSKISQLVNRKNKNPNNKGDNRNRSTWPQC